MAYGGHTPAADPHRQQVWRESVRELQEIPLEELVTLVDFPDGVALDNAYADISSKGLQSGNVTDMLEAPIPKDFTEKYPEVVGRLACNTAIYDDELEDKIAEDPVIQTLREASRNHGNIADYSPEEVARAIRIRRSIIALVKSQQPDVIIEQVNVPKDFLQDKTPVTN